jgi:hypothetical protein
MRDPRRAYGSKQQVFRSVKLGPGNFASMAVPGLFAVSIEGPSEWRRWKHRPLVAIEPDREAQRVVREVKREDNDRRIVDSRSYRNQAYGKMKRAGIYDTKRRA